jgi:two-component system NtrC family sensor kinase
MEDSSASVPHGAVERWDSFRRHAFDELRITRKNVVPLALLTTGAIAVGDILTGAEVVFTLLYLVPIALAVWFRGRGLGGVLSVVSVASTSITEVVERVHHGQRLRPWVMVWNHGGSFLIFVVFVWLVSRLRAYADQEQLARRATVEQLRQAERLGVVGQLAAGVAHELGTPLNVIVGHAEMIDSDDMSRTMLRASSRTILGQAEKMIGIIRGLLDFSRSGGSLRSVVDLAALATSASSLVRTLVTKQAVDVEVHLPEGEPITVLGNRTELEQVLVNLMMNGAQAMPDGGHLRVVVRSEPRRGSTPPAACVEVSDEGAGISPENLPRIFDPFFTTKDVGAGTGLGLSVSYGIVSDHQGRIDVSSVVGAGSCFSVLLPLREVSS